MKKFILFVIIFELIFIINLFADIEKELQAGDDKVTITAKNTDGSVIEIEVVKTKLDDNSAVKNFLFVGLDSYSAIKDITTSITVKVNYEEVLTLNALGGEVNARGIIFKKGKNKDFEFIIYGGHGTMSFKTMYYFNEINDGCKKRIWLTKKVEGGNEGCGDSSKTIYYLCCF